ncbi:MAG: glycosyltransferase N-terminal domain-containing protein [Flavobacteriaceae bacterium]|nr:glycosyltransferase N-terminal domain-containing protein [Flavobacteriaceae bacterium]MDG2315258.1 glycosyltransferase N-terminal domain-containing protein [Flavobacteriaceae bacterium]
MQFVYSLLTQFIQSILPIGSLGGGKVKLFVKGRKNTFDQLKKALHSNDKTFWFHAASLGEYEQGVPIIEAIKKTHPNHKIVITFFSPSGYEIKKNNPLADVTTYLPLDTPKNVQRFLNIVRPEKAFFIKYEFWPNYLKQLKKLQIPTYLIAGMFRENQWFFKPSGNWMRKTLSCFTHFFLQNNTSKQLLKGIGFNNISISGDTRYDRVGAPKEPLPFMESFKGTRKCVVAGSTWPEDEAVLLDAIHATPNNWCWLIAPHEMHEDKIDRLMAKLPEGSRRYTQTDISKLSNCPVLVLDTIGVLSRCYAYASIAYVGGGMGTSGLHNILEPAAEGIPIIIGKNYAKFPEAIELISNGGVISVASANSCSEQLKILMEDNALCQQKGKKNYDKVTEHQGATQRILDILNHK